MSKPFTVTVTIDDAAFDSPLFNHAVAYELSEAAKMIIAEQDRRRQLEREAFWRDIGRPADGHLGAVGGE